MFKLIFLLLLAPQTFASIYGEDDRVDVSEASSQMQEIANSVPALILSDYLKPAGNGRVKLQGTPLSDYDLCSDEKFFEEQSVATCSSSLIAPDKILTAAHCLSERPYTCDNYRVVFGYQNGTSEVLQEDIYSCEKILYHKFDIFGGEDIAIIQLDRPVKNRKVLDYVPQYDFRIGEPLSMIGYPLGISQKVVESGEVLSVNRTYQSFRHNLDTFSVNSGGPIFNKSGQIVGVLVRGTGGNLSWTTNSCSEWERAQNYDFAEGNDLSSLK